jgi:meiotically up-regulated gene 157 (Mug157) protein
MSRRLLSVTLSRRLHSIALTRRLLSIALTLAVLASTGVPARAEESSAVAATLQKLYQTAYDEAINRHASLQPDGTTYVSSGDIDAEWLRDAAAVMEPYIPLAGSDERIREMLRGTVARMARCILLDPYANAYWANYKVAEHKFEVDSLLYPIWFAGRYYEQTGDRSIFTPEVRRAFARVLRVLRDEQHHGSRSGYTHPELGYAGKGSPVRFTGMVWTGFRPSDDPARYHYNVPVNMFAVVVLRRLSALERRIFGDKKAAAEAWGLAVQVRAGIERYGTVRVADLGKIYAYEVDGLGKRALMDDANVPSLLSAPFFGYVPAGNAVYRNTRAFVLSARNPYFYTGKYAVGVGSAHTPRGFVWPLSLVVQVLTSDDDSEVQRVMGYIAAADVGDHRLHESFDADWPERFTREDFAWPNALYAELVRKRVEGESR